MENLIQDIRFGLRRLFKSPGFALIAIASLALGIGANTAIFSLVNTVLFKSLPVPNPQQVFSIAVRGNNDSMQAFSYPNYQDFRDKNDVLTGLIVHRFAPMSLSIDGANERVWGYLVSGNYFDVLGVQPIKGRGFLPEEDQAPLSHPVVVISHGCWQRRFGGDPDIVGKDIRLNGHPFKIIGVAPEGFRGVEIIYTPEIWAPLNMDGWIEPGATWLEHRDSQNLFATGRLKPGVSATQAEASLNILAKSLGEEYPDANEGQTIQLIQPGLVLPDLRGAVVSFTAILMVAVLLVLLIACTNLAGLLLARATERRREIAIRLSLGASRLRLTRQLLTESVLLSTLGGVVGVTLAWWMLSVATRFKPPIDFPLTIDLRVDWRVIGFSIAISLVTGIVFGLVPAVQATRPDIVTALKDTTAQAGYRRSLLRSGLVVIQLALSLILLIGAGLVVRALRQVETMNPGFDTSNMMTMGFDVGLQGYDRAKGEQFYRDAVERMHRVPGVKSAAIADFLPLSLNFSANGVYVEGEPSERGSNVPITMVATVGSEYFETMGIPMLSGRGFNTQDLKDSVRVAIVNETFARKLLPRINSIEDAIGRRFSFESGKGPFLQIVGVARDGKYFNIGEEPRSFAYTALTQTYSPNAAIIVRTAGDPTSMIGTLRGELQSLDPTLPIFGVKTMTEHMQLSLLPARTAASVLGVFGLLALILAAIGIYGIMSYTVAQRTREIGIRSALGAARGDVFRLVIGQGMKLTLIGLLIGLAVALLLTRLLSSLLFGVSATDPLTYIGISLLFGLVAFLASYLPARRATLVDPMIALRYE